MRRTILGVGVGVLASMTFAPHSHCWAFVWSRQYYDWMEIVQNRFPLFADTGFVLWRDFFAQTAFAAVLAGILANLRHSSPASASRTATTERGNNKRTGNEVYAKGEGRNGQINVQCHMCSQQKKSVRSRTNITVGLNSGKVRWQFCDECAAKVAAQPTQPNQGASPIAAIERFFIAAKEFEQRARRMVWDGDFAGAKDQFDLAIKARATAQCEETAQRGDAEKVAMPGVLIGDTPATVKMLNELGYETTRDGDGTIASIRFPHTAEQDVLSAYAFQYWTNGRPPNGKPPGLIEFGNIEALAYPIAQSKPDGAFDHVRVISIEHDAEIVVIPTVTPEDKDLTDEEAIQRYLDTGHHFGVFTDENAASAYQGGIAEAEEQRINGTEIV